MGIVKFTILFLAWAAMFLGALLLGVSKFVGEARHEQHRVMQQRRDDAHNLHDWRLR